MTSHALADALDVETRRRSAAHALSITLGAQALVAGVGLGVVAGGWTINDAFGAPFLITTLIVLGALSALASLAEWSRERLGEGFAIAAVGLGIAVAAALFAEGLVWLAAAQGLVALAGAAFVAARLVVRDPAGRESS